MMNELFTHLSFLPLKKVERIYFEITTKLSDLDYSHEVSVI